MVKRERADPVWREELLFVEQVAEDGPQPLRGEDGGEMAAPGTGLVDVGDVVAEMRTMVEEPVLATRRPLL